jgi:glycosyltransferase involved in cell wall biosynthesis
MVLKIMDNQNNFVSVIMPIYNGEKYLTRAIESILNQSHSYFEFIIINDGSTDSSLSIVKSYKDNRIKLLNQNNKGTFNSYNTGFKEAAGKIIFIMDQDDISHTERIEQQLDFMMSKNLDLCGTFYNIIDQSGNIIEKRKLPVNYNQIINQLYYKNHTIFNPTVAIKKEIFSMYGYFDPVFFPSADYEFYLRICRNIRLSNTPLFLYSWRYNELGVSNSNKEQVFEKTRKISLFYVDKDKEFFLKNKFLFTKGKINYYNNKLFYASFNFIAAIIRGEISYHVVKYLLLTTIFCFPLKVIRKYETLLYHPLIIKMRHIFGEKA